MKTNHVLVTGAHRSGTTFIGKVLSLNESIGYVYEPYNAGSGLSEITNWFTYVSEGNDVRFKKIIDDLLSGRAKYKRVPLHKGKRNPVSILGKLVFGNKANYDYMKIMNNKNINRLLIKDPIASLSSEWLHQKYNMDVVVIFRHPAAFVGSLKRLGWHFDFNNLLNQKELMDRYLVNVLPRDKTVEQLNKLSPVEQGIILWNCIYYVLDKYIERNPQFIAVKHEDISKSPIEQFEILYEKLGIPYTQEIKNIIHEWTSVKNPVAPKKNEVHVLQRNSKDNIKRWKKLLSDKEIQNIKNQVNELYYKYYSENDW